MDPAKGAERLAELGRMGFRTMNLWFQESAAAEQRERMANEVLPAAGPRLAPRAPPSLGVMEQRYQAVLADLDDLPPGGAGRSLPPAELLPSPDERPRTTLHLSRE